MRSLIRHSRNRHGIALPAALGFLILLDFLVIGALFAARRQRHGSDLRLLDAALTTSADGALFADVESWPVARRAAMRIGDVDSTTATTAEPTPALVATRVTRLSESVYWAAAEARSSADSSARHRTGIVLRVPSSSFDAYALASAGDVTLGSDVHILPEIARDTSGGCVPREAAAAVAILLRQGANVSFDSAKGSAPATRSVSDSAFQFSLGGESWSSLAGRATLRLGAGAEHDANLPSLAYGAGDLTLIGGSGSGVLLVEGRLTIAGASSYSGLVLARGGVRTSADSAVFRGALVSLATESPTGAPVDLRHTLRLQASKCAVRRALSEIMRPRVAGSRAWAELF